MIYYCCTMDRYLHIVQKILGGFAMNLKANVVLALLNLVKEQRLNMSVGQFAVFAKSQCNYTITK